MKKSALFLILLAVLMGPTLFAEGNIYAVKDLIESGIEQNADKISALAATLTVQEKENLYEMTKKDPLVPFALNLLVGCGVGSYVQGAVGTGVLCTTLEVLGATGVFGGYVFAVSGLVLTMPSGSTKTISNSELTNMAIIGTAITVTGAVMWLSGKVIGLASPWDYANQFNEKVHDALFKPVIANAPQFMPFVSVAMNCNNEPTPMIGISLNM